MNPLAPLLDHLGDQPDFLSALLKAEGVSPNAQPVFLASLARHRRENLGTASESTEATTVVVTPTAAQAEELTRELSIWLESVRLFPAWETFPFERVSPTWESMAGRQRALWELRENPPEVLVAPLGAMTQRLVPSALQVSPLQVSKGQTVDRDELIAKLISWGYKRCPQVEHRGNLAVRGSIIDVFEPSGANPIRLDLWGDQIDRLCEFSPTHQRSLGDIQQAQIFPLRELLPIAEIKQRAAELRQTAPWGNQWWNRLAEGEMFDGMESYLPWLITDEVLLGDILRESSLVVCLELERLRARADDIEAEEAELVAAFAKTWAGEEIAEGTTTGKFPPLHVSFERSLSGFAGEIRELGSFGGKDQHKNNVTSLETISWDAPVPRDDKTSPLEQHEALGAAGPLLMLKKLLSENYAVTVATESEGSAERIISLLAEGDIHLPHLPAASAVSSGVVAAPLHQGFILSDQKLAVLTEAQITGKRRARRREAAASKPVSTSPTAAKATAKQTTASHIPWRESIPFEPGSYVVHRHHGIAKYAGIHTRELEGQMRDYLLLEYRGKDKLFVPVEQLDALRAYTGGETPKLSRMGGADWQRTCGKVRAAAAEIAEELVELYRTRQVSGGFAFAEDSPWQEELEASFPFEETPDQAQAIVQVKSDMEAQLPMDRLVCGDVGFGKTEVAVRAAFKAIQNKKQVAMLVPTTLLAQQHFETFTERFGSFGVRLEVLSRLVSPAEAKSAIAGIKTGEVQMVIGTHRLLSKDIKFQDLGLLILDEEQRFGVRHKEKIKAMRTSVDVLTLTATPIPRTLEMSLTGIRDLSLIQTPPADRRPIFTYVGAFDERAVSEAVRRELLREGQVFYIHNRVRTIEERTAQLQELIPEAKFVSAHGQMETAQLEEVSGEFVEGKHDVLVCSTIIESGIDIPSVNTLVVEGAHRFGLAQLHQLRGRVGRSNQRAYAYLFTPPGIELTEEAYERLRIVEEHNELGAGALVAMRDLEMRGAGNLLGVGQSGHIAAVGYDLYCQLVSEKVSELKEQMGLDRGGQTGGLTGQATKNLEVDLDLLRSTHIPESYMPHEATRLEAYRAVAAAKSVEDVLDLEASWRDRFGELPPEAHSLLDIARLRSACISAGIAQVKVRRSQKFGGLVATISPVELPVSRQVRLDRLYPGSDYVPSAKELHLKCDTAPEITEAIQELLE